MFNKKSVTKKKSLKRNKYFYLKQMKLSQCFSEKVFGKKVSNLKYFLQHSYLDACL